MSVLILASSSESRRQILTAAGVPFHAMIPRVDEGKAKASLIAGGACAEEIAVALAALKATQVAGDHPAASVLGCDQVLVCGGRLFDKAASLREARELLMELRGREHELVTAAILLQGAATLWRHVERVRLWMRDFSDGFLDQYLRAEREGILSCVGCYRIEGRGAQLFSQIEGDHFAIRGLPLVPLLDALRRHDLVPA